MQLCSASVARGNENGRSERETAQRYAGHDPERGPGVSAAAARGNKKRSKNKNNGDPRRRAVGTTQPDRFQHVGVLRSPTDASTYTRRGRQQR